MSHRTTIKVALDWTPNTIHSGLFCALNKQIYGGEGLDVQLLPPDPEYSTTPAKRLQNGEVDLAICPSESVIAYNETGRMKLQAVYAILQRDASAIVSTKHQTIASLDGGLYGSYNAKYEDDIVKHMVTSAGGNSEGMQIKSSSPKLSLFDEVKNGDLDATWVFMPWEGIEAELDGVSLHAFRLEDFGVPYGYSPVLARNVDSSLDSDTLRKFISATAKGYEFALHNPEEAAAIMLPHCKPERSSLFLERSQQSINGYYKDSSESRLGYMRPSKWEDWIGWLKKKGLLQKDIGMSKLFTNEFFS